MRFISLSLITILCWACTLQALQAQTKNTDTAQIDLSFIEDSGPIIPIQDPNGFLWGLKDTITGKLVLPYKYHSIRPFVEGRAVVVLNGFYGYISAKGEEIVSPCLGLRLAWNFNNGYAVVKYDLWHSEYDNLINYEGKLLFRPGSANNPYWKVYVDNKSILRQRIVVEKNYRVALLDFDNNFISPFIYGGIRIHPNGLCQVHLAGQQKYGFWDWNGNEIHPMIFDNVGEFREGIAIVIKDGKWGCIDESGKELFYTDYDKIEPFYNGFARVYKEYKEVTYILNGVERKGSVGKRGYVNKLGEEVVSLNYTEAFGTDNSSAEKGLFVEGFAPVRLIDDILKDRRTYCGFIDTTGKPITPFKYSRVEYFKNGLAKVMIGKHYGFINYEGEEIIPIIYDVIDVHNHRRPHLLGTMINNTYIFAKRDSIYSFIDLHGKVIASYNYDDMEPFFRKGRFLSFVTKNKKKGLIDFVSGKVIIPIEYDYYIGGDVFAFGKGEEVVEEQMKYFDVNGKKTAKPPFYISSNEFGRGIVKVENKEKYGLINLSKKLIVPCVYDEIDYFSGGMAVVKKNGKYGFLDYSGKLVIPTIYDNVEPFEPGYYYTKVVKNGETFAIDRTGKIFVDDDW